MIVSRIEDLLDIQVRLGDGMPQRVCPKCKCRLERGTEDLQDFWSQACTSYNEHHVAAPHTGPLKHKLYGLNQVRGTNRDQIKTRLFSCFYRASF